MLKRFLVRVIAAALQLGAASADDYPNRPITLVVPYAPGGGTDASARVVARAMASKLGQNIIVENRPGAGTLIGSSFVARASANGYTLLYGSISHSAAPATTRERVTFDPVKDFTPISEVATFPLVILVKSTLGVRTLPELIAKAKAAPGKLNYASVGYGTATHLAGETFKLGTGTDIVHVPYNGSAPAITALMAGQVEIAFSDPPPAIPFIQEGTFVPLGVTTPKPSSALPNVPPIAEAAKLPGYEFSSWWGIFGPARLPPEITAKLNAAIHYALQQEEVRQTLATFAADPAGNTPQEFGAFVRNQVETFAQAAKAARIAAQ